MMYSNERQPCFHLNSYKQVSAVKCRITTPLFVASTDKPVMSGSTPLYTSSDLIWMISTKPPVTVGYCLSNLRLLGSVQMLNTVQSSNWTKIASKIHSWKQHLMVPWIVALSGVKLSSSRARLPLDCFTIFTLSSWWRKADLYSQNTRVLPLQLLQEHLILVPIYLIFFMLVYILKFDVFFIWALLRFKLSYLSYQSPETRTVPANLM